MLRRWPVLLVFVFWSGLSHAQTPSTTDSLLQVIASDAPDSARFDALLGMAGYHLGSRTDSAQFYCTEARTMAPRTGRPADVGEAEGWLGYVAEQLGLYNQSTEHYRASLVESRKLKDRMGEATVLNNLAALYKDRGLTDSALVMHHLSLNLRQTMGDSAGVATSLNNIALLRNDQGHIEEAIELFNRSLANYTFVNDPDGVATVLLNLASIYRHLKDFNQAIDHLHKASAIVKNINDNYVKASIQDNLGGVYTDMHLYAKAQNHYRDALALHQSVLDKRGMGYSLRYLAELQLKQHKTDSALMYADQAYYALRDVDDKRGLAAALCTRGTVMLALGRIKEAQTDGEQALAIGSGLGNMILKRDVAKLLDQVYRSQGLWQKAIEMKDLLELLNDSLVRSENQAAGMRSAVRYEFDLKEAELQAAQDKQNALNTAEVRRHRLVRNGSMVGLLFALLFAAVVFVQRNRIAHARQRSEELLLNILPKEVAEELKATGSAEAKLLDEVTVLFTDFKGFTALSEQVSAKQLVEDLHECFTAFDHICEKHGIEKIKTIGDSYMAAGGLPLPCADHAHRAVKAALEIRDFIEQRAQSVSGLEPSLDAPNPSPLQIRIGIHTGPVIAGIVGVKKFSYDIWGDTVNTASRMESSGEAGKVNISQATYALVKDDFTCEYRGEVEAKGKGKLGMWFVSKAIYMAI